MVAALIPGPIDWSLDRDEDGHREYTLVRQVATTSTRDGPATVLTCPGLPLPGSIWLVDNDTDVWAWCRPNARIRRHDDCAKQAPCKLWFVELKFSTKPLKKSLCSQSQFDDPLQEPMEVSGSFLNKQEEATHDRFGQELKTSSHEQVRGPDVEFDVAYPQVVVKQNVLDLQLKLCSRTINTVNESSLWGLDPRMIKLSDFRWEKKYHGQCYEYYTRTFTFDINARTFDRILPDEGTKVLYGHWDQSQGGRWILDPIDLANLIPDKDNPSHFIRATDRYGNPCRILLDGSGKPWNPAASDKKFWCLNDGSDTSLCFEGDCYAAQAYAKASGFTSMAGPFASSLACSTACGNATSGTDPDSFDCTGLVSSPKGEIPVEYYPESDLLQLGIPVNL